MPETDRVVASPRPVWRDRTFITYWTSTSLGTIGFQVTLVAMPLVAVLTLHATARDTGLLRALLALPNLLFGLVAGVWVDRLPRRPILIATAIAGAAGIGSIPIAYALGWLALPQLYVTTFIAGAVGAFGGVAASAYLPSIVDRERLVEANSRIATTNSAIQIVGPSLGGLLVQILTAPITLAFEAVMGVLSAITLATIRKPEPPTKSTERNLRSEVAEGIRVVLGHSVLRVLLLLVGLANFFSALAQAVFVLYMARQLRLPPAGIGLVFAAAGPGSLLGAVVANRLSRRLGIGAAMVVGASFFGLGWTIAPLAAGPPIVVLLTLMLSQFLLFGGAVVANVNVGSLRQAITPQRLLGRVSGSMLIAFQGVVPAGALVGGFLGDRIGLRQALVVAAVGSLAAVLVVVASPLRRVRTADEAVIIDPLT